MANGDVLEYWRKEIPELADKITNLDVRGKTLVVGVADHGHRYLLDRWLSSGGSARTIASVSRRVTTIRLARSHA